MPLDKRFKAALQEKAVEWLYFGAAMLEVLIMLVMHAGKGGKS